MIGVPDALFLADSMNSCRILDLDAIRNSLEEVQAQFELLNTRLDEQREPFDDVVCRNMLQGYALIDRLVVDIDHSHVFNVPGKSKTAPREKFSKVVGTLRVP